MEKVENLEKLSVELENAQKEKEHVSKQKAILQAKLEAIKKKQQEEIKRIKEALKKDLQRSEKYFAYLFLHIIENADDKIQEEIAKLTHSYIMSKNNIKEKTRLQMHVNNMIDSGKTIYKKLDELNKSMKVTKKDQTEKPAQPINTQSHTT